MNTLQAIFTISSLLLILFWCLLVTTELSCQARLDRAILQRIVISKSGVAKITKNGPMPNCQQTQYLKRNDYEQIQKKFIKNFL
jgi:hypothetical protein